MDSYDLLKNEYNLAFESYKFYTNSKSIFLRIFLTFFILFTTFLIKGDLPENLFLLLAILVLGYLYYHNWLTHKQVSCWMLWNYMELKINKRLETENNSNYRIDLTKTLGNLLFGTKELNRANKLTQAVYFIILLIILEYTILRGSMSITNDLIEIIGIHVLFYLLVILYVFITKTQNTSRQKTFEELQKKQHTVD